MESRLAAVDLDAMIGRKDYAARLDDLQHAMRTIELAYRRFDLRACIVLEGWDAAGKGGLIRRMTARMDPRGFQVWPIAAPKAHFHGRHYLERFWARLPEPGMVAIFDRSWYGRVLVERVEGFAEEAEWRRAYDEINNFERMLTNDGVRVVKLFLHVSAEEQERRFRARLDDPWKRWKLTVEDFRNVERRDAYEAAIDEMLARTDRPDAPWRVISGEQKRHGRIAALSQVAEHLGAGVDLGPPPLDPDVEALAAERLKGD
ncbi:MAG: polyphosphate kinase [Rhizobiales bacterium NRL2]|jgi:polyphosphate kinase 2 (PPK2 family)|nr:MAG: polyphosphate kinase [Rhizobiales bacterium NRL2]